jgi:hypothetical protein
MDEDKKELEGAARSSILPPWHGRLTIALTPLLTLCQYYDEKSGEG